MCRSSKSYFALSSHHHHSFHTRYARQISLSGFGLVSQESLSTASILVIGVGGLGCPAIQCLSAAGVGKIGMVDFDKVSLTNIHRQMLFYTTDVGRPKVEVATERIEAINPHVEVHSYQTRLDSSTIFDILEGEVKYDVVLDCTDNFSTRYLISDVCQLLGICHVFGALSTYQGQLGVFDHRTGDEARSYRDLFPHPPAQDQIPTCNEAGILGTVSSTIGTMMANETIKCITHTSTPLTNQILVFDLGINQTQTFVISSHPDAQRPTREFIIQNDYELECGITSEQDRATDEVTAKEAVEMINTIPSIRLIDIREEYETPFLEGIPHEKVPLSRLQRKLLEPLDSRESTVLFVCQAGIRSLHAVEMHREVRGRFISVKGGAVELLLESKKTY